MTTVVLDPTQSIDDPSGLSSFHVVAWQNLLLDDAVTVTGGQQSADKAVTNAASWSMIDRWRSDSSSGGVISIDFGAAQTIDSFALYGHNLASVAGNVQVEYSADEVVWSDFVPARSVDRSGPLYVYTPASQFARWWRVTFTTSAAPEVANLFLGRSMVLPYPPSVGFTPPPLGRQHRLRTAVSGDGLLLDRSLTREVTRTSIALPVVSIAFARSTWNNFRAHAERYPFYYSWCADNYPQDAAFCYSDGDVPGVPYSYRDYQSISISCRALTE